MNTKQEAGVFDLMKSSRNEAEWNANCDLVKSANNGAYPTYWFETIIQSGLAAVMQRHWLRDAQEQEQLRKPEPRVVVVDQIGDQPRTITGRIVESCEAMINRALIDLAMVPRRPTQIPLRPELVGMGQMEPYTPFEVAYEREQQEQREREARTKAYIAGLVATGEQTPEEGRRQASKAKAKRQRKQERRIAEGRVSK